MGDRIRQARDRRERLYEMLVALEAANAAPVKNRTAWCANLRETLGEVATVLDEHIAGTEGPAGLFEELLVDHARLHARIGQLQQDHKELTATVEDLMGRCADAFEPDDVREDVVRLLGHMTRHRHRGADLLYEAYAVDVSSGD